MTRATGVAALLAVVAVAASACSRQPEAPRPESTPAPAPATSAPPAPAPQATGAAAARQDVVAEPSGPLPVPVTSSVARAGEISTPLSFNEPTLVDPAARFHVEAALALSDARLSLVDSGDAMIAAAESHEIGATWSRFMLVPDGPLRPGSTYTLRLDGAAEREAHDSDGRAYQVATWPIRVGGEPPPPEKPAPRGKRR